MPGYSFGKDLTADSDDDGGASRRSGAGPSRRTDAGASARPGGGDFSHLDAEGHARMVDVGEKPVTARAATASAVVRTTPAVVAAIRDRSVPKGDVLAVARIAGIQGAKRTSELIPLCHPLALEAVDVELALEDAAVRITATARLHGRTGVEMEALTAAAVAALAVYDMCKALDRGMVIEDVRLERKSGGRSGDWERPRA